jgi:hypothetical protein
VKLLLKLLLAGAILHGSWRAGAAYWKYYAFVDDVQSTAQFAGEQTIPELHARVMQLASALDVPLSAEHVNVRRQDTYTFIDVEYVDRIEILPRYFYPWKFDVSVEAFTVRLPTSSDFVTGGGR